MSDRVRVNKKIRGHRVVERKWNGANRSIDSTTSYSVASGEEEVAYIKASYWTSGVDDAYHQYEVAAEVGGKVVFMRKSQGFGYRARRDAIRQRTGHLAIAFDRVRAALLADRQDAPAPVPVPVLAIVPAAPKPVDIDPGDIMNQALRHSLGYDADPHEELSS